MVVSIVVHAMFVDRIGVYSGKAEGRPVCSKLSNFGGIMNHVPQKNRIKLFRVAKGLSRQQLAGAVGVNPQTK